MADGGSDGSEALLCSTWRAQPGGSLAAGPRQSHTWLLVPADILLPPCSRANLPPLQQGSIAVSLSALASFPSSSVSIPFRSKGPGQARGARSLPIPTAIKASSQTAVQCCVDHSIPGKRSPGTGNCILLWEGGPWEGQICHGPCQHKRICSDGEGESFHSPEKGWRWMSR